MKNKEKIDRLTPCALIQASKKTGKVSKVLYTRCGYAMLQLWAIQNTPKTKECYICTQDGLLLSRYEGNTAGLPKVTWYEDNESIEDIIPGAVAVFKENITT